MNSTQNEEKSKIKTKILGWQSAASQKEKPNTTEKITETIDQPQAKCETFLDKSIQASPHMKDHRAKRGQAFWYLITVAISISSTIVVFVLPEQLYPWNLIRQTLGALLVLWFPGYSLYRMIRLNHAFMDSSSQTERTTAVIGLSICLSLAIAALVTLVLNYTPWGIRSDSVTLSLLGVIVLFSTVAVVREHQQRSRLR